MSRSGSQPNPGILLRHALEQRGIRDPLVLKAIEEVPRDRFLSAEQADVAWDDAAQPLEAGQTISQPYIVGLMTEALQLRPDSHVLEIGTGSGYQAAVLSRLCRSVVTVERLPQLHERASRVLRALGIHNVRCVPGDGCLGFPEEAPYDGIIVTAAAATIPEQLPLQLAPGGRLVIPVDSGERDNVQDLLIGTWEQNGFTTRTLCQCRFVPLIAGQPDDLPRR